VAAIAVTATPATTLRYLMTERTLRPPLPIPSRRPTLLVGMITLMSKVPRSNFHRSTSATNNSSSPTTRWFDRSIAGILFAIEPLCGRGDMIAPSSR
jgi:hypothetical protein